MVRYRASSEEVAMGVLDFLRAIQDRGENWRGPWNWHRLYRASEKYVEARTGKDFCTWSEASVLQVLKSAGILEKNNVTCGPGVRWSVVCLPPLDTEIVRSVTQCCQCSQNIVKFIIEKEFTGETHDA